MVRIELQKEDGKGIEGNLYLAEDSDFPITKNIADLQDISKRKGTFSKTVKVAGRRETNHLLNHLYNINSVTGDFDRNKRQRCIVYVDDFPILDNCVMQITSIEKLQNVSSEEQSIIYNVNIKSETVNFFEKIKEKELTDLTLKFNDGFAYTPTTLAQTFNNDVSDGFKMALRNVIDNSAGLTDFTPAIYLKKYFDAILKEAGYRYTFEEVGVENSEVINSRDDLLFHKLLMPFTGDIPDTTSSEKEFYKGVSEQAMPDTYTPNWGSGILNGTGIQPVLNENILQDDSSSMTADEYVADFSGILRVNLNVSFLIRMEVQAGSAHLQSTPFSNPPMTFAHSMYVYKNNVLMSILSKDVYTINIGTSFGAGLTTLTDSELAHDFPTDVVPGDVIKISHSLAIKNIMLGVPFTTTSSNNVPANVRFIMSKITRTSTFTTLVHNSLSYGAFLDVSRFIPKKIKQTDFIKSVLNLFNILVDVDENDANLLIFKTRDYYYDSGNEHDFTDLFDKSEKHTIEWLSDSQKKSKVFSFKKLDKSLNLAYYEKHNEVYGQQTFIFDNEHIKGNDKLEVIFTPTPHYAVSGGFYVSDLSVKDSLPIVYDGGNINKSLQLLGWSGTPNAISGVYPLTIHLDRVNNPTRDLNFGTPLSYFWSGAGITNGNLFNLHYRRTLWQLNSGKILKCKIKLTSLLFRKLKLNDRIFIKDSWYIINSIKDYNLTKNQTVEFELITIDDEQTLDILKPIIGIVIDQISVPVSGISSPTPPPFSGNNLVFNPISLAFDPTPIGNTVIGIGNLVSSFSAKVVGNRNIVTGIGSSVIGSNTVSFEDNEMISKGVVTDFETRVKKIEIVTTNNYQIPDGTDIVRVDGTTPANIYLPVNFTEGSEILIINNTANDIYATANNTIGINGIEYYGWDAGIPSSYRLTLTRVRDYFYVKSFLEV